MYVISLGYIFTLRDILNLSMALQGRLPMAIPGSVAALVLSVASSVLPTGSAGWFRGCARYPLADGILQNYATDPEPFFRSTGATVPQFILLVHPHGLWSETGALWSMHVTVPAKTVLLVDPILYFSSPIGMVFIKAITGLEVSWLRHSNICRLLDEGYNLILFAGGFEEAVSFSNTQDIFFFNRYDYWLWVGRKYQVEVHSLVCGDGASRYWRQSGFAGEARLAMARWRIPAALPIGVALPRLGTLKPITFRVVGHPPDASAQEAMDAVRAAIAGMVTTVPITCRM